MRHVHLPKLEEDGVIEWNHQPHQVVRGPNVDESRPLLEPLADHTDGATRSWPESNGAQPGERDR